MNQLTRRDFLKKGSMGFGMLAASSLFQRDLLAGVSSPLSPKVSHIAPKAKSVIFLYMDGGVSQVDSFDPKPQLAKENGQIPKFKMDATVFNNSGSILKSPWDFKQYGESGIPVSDLFPHIGSCADDLCVIRSMTALSPNHPNANYALHCGHVLSGRPSMGAWASYGLGTTNQNLPSYVVINGGLIPPGGVQTLGSGFLPANHQASIIVPETPVMNNISPREPLTEMQRKKLDYLNSIDNVFSKKYHHADQVEAAIENYELAFRMQMEVPEVTDISKETEATKRLYGMDSGYANTRQYGSQCLIARRLVEQGVRFIELTMPAVSGADRWDQHGNLIEGHEKNAFTVDQPIAGLIKDLKSRGLLDSTLLVFSGEFGRTPFAQGKDGRDHNPQGFSMWMAGGGIKGGTIYGATDEYGYRAIENKVNVHDLHANMLHLMGINHKELTYRFSGRDVRLTDVHGELIPEILA
ncbi:MAG: DUF1501 domain-containing protein [Akkermansiaceae bacterium]